MSAQASVRPRVLPLVLATMASQAMLVVLSPTLVAIASDLGTSVGTAGQARSVTALVAIAVAVALAGRIDGIGVRRLLAAGGLTGVVACATVAAAPGLEAFLAAHLLVGVAFACLLSAGFGGVAAFPVTERAWAIGYVAGANALAWIIVTPAVGIVTDELSWRAAQVVPALIALAALLGSAYAAPAPGSGDRPRLRPMLGDGSARRWLISELIAFGSWTALLTFIGAFLVGEGGVGEGTVGWLLAAGAGAYFLAATRLNLATAVSRRALIALSTVAMAALIAVQFSPALPVAGAVVCFCLIGLAAGLRTPASSALGLVQIPESPGAMMAARTAVTQIGYLIGALAGGTLIAGPGYVTLGLVSAAGLMVAAALVLGVNDPDE